MTKQKNTKRNPDWNGNPPKHDRHARELIIDAAVKVAERDGIQKTNIKKVADELGVTRQTVYRLFPSSDELLTQLSVAAGGKILDKLFKNAARFDNFEDRMIESVIFMIRHIPNDKFLKQYFVVSKEAMINIPVAFDKESIKYSFQILKGIYPENSKSTLDDKWLMELADHAQRMVLALIIAPGENAKSTKALRTYLDKWLRPLL